MRKFWGLVVAVAMIFSFNGESFAGLNDGLVAFWTFDQNANDQVGSHNGTIYGDTNIQPGIIGQSYYFDGSGDYMIINPNLNSELSGSPFTVATWVKVTGIPDFPPSKNAPFITNDVHQKPNRFVVYDCQNGKVGITFQVSRGTSDNEIVTVCDLNLNQWYHVAATLDYSTLKLYLNGNLVDSISFSFTEIATWNGIFYIGGNHRIGRYLDGYLDDIRVYNRTLSVNDIIELYMLGGSNDDSPTAVFENSSGQPSAFPDSLVVGQTYRITAKYTDSNKDLNNCFLKINHPQYPVGMVYNVVEKYNYGDINADNYLSPFTVDREDLPDGSGVILTWNFFLKANLPLVQDSIDLEILALDKNENTSGWNPAGRSLSYAKPEFGATIITHGFLMQGEPVGWTTTMGRAIGKRLGNAVVYQLNPVTGLFESLTVGTEGPGDDFQKIFIMDWAKDSINISTQGFSEAAADAFLAALIRHQIDYPEPYFLDRLHFIGHSRGCVVTSEMIERIVRLKKNPQTVKNFQFFADNISVTYLDPHPVYSPGAINGTDKVNPVETEKGQVKVWDSHIYAENYYQGNFDSSFSGIRLDNLYNRDLDNSVNINFNHSEVHRWYHGTIDPEADTDGKEPIQRNIWYKDKLGLIEGFAHSNHGGNNIENRKPIQHNEKPYRNYISETVFNGDFKYPIIQILHMPGWEYQGGDGDGDVADEHLRLFWAQKSRSHNWLYIPSNAKRLSFRYEFTPPLGTTPPYTDELRVSLDLGNGEPLKYLKDQVKLNQKTFSYEPITYDISEYAGEVVRIKFEIVNSKGNSINSLVYIDDVRLGYGSLGFLPYLLNSE